MGDSQGERSISPDQLVKWFRSLGRRDRWTVIGSIGIIVMMIVASVIVLKGVNKEEFTEFYVLNAEGKAYNYPRQVVSGNVTSIILGVANHEGRTVNYTVEAWLVDYTLIDMAVNVTQMYYVDSFTVILDSADYQLGEQWVAQYERPTVLNLTVPGNFTLIMMMFVDGSMPNPELLPFYTDQDYSKTNATWRVVMMVNNEMRSLRLSIEVIEIAAFVEGQDNRY